MNRTLSIARAASLCFIIFGLSDCIDTGAKVGLPAPALNLERLGGGNVDIGGLKGKVVLVNFWATWCGPCREEMPDLERLHRALEGQQFTILAVSVDQRRSDVEKFAAEKNLTMPILLDSKGQIARLWGTSIFPESYIIGPDGNVADKVIGMIDYNKTLAAVKSMLPKR